MPAKLVKVHYDYKIKIWQAFEKAVLSTDIN